MLDNYPDTFAMVQIHISDAYTYPWGTARQSFYGITGIPSAMFDGVIKTVGNQGYSGYLNRYNQRRAVPTDVTIELSGEQVSGRTYRISAEVCIEPDGQAKTMRIYMVQLLDYWPAVGGYHRNGFKQAATTQDITLAPGDCQVLQREFTFDDDSWNDQDNITMVAWAQVPNNIWPAEVYQAAIMDWPFCVPADITEQPESVDACVGDTVIFSVTVDPVDEVTYQWWCGETELVDDGEHIFGATTDELMLVNVTEADVAEDYYCLVTKVENDCTRASGDAALTVAESPIFSSHPSDQTVDIGDPVFFRASVEEHGFTEQYQWRKDGADLTDDGRIFGSRTPMLLITSVEIGDAGEYDCVVTYAENGCSRPSDAATLTVIPSECPGDVDGDGDTDHSDLGELLAAWCTHEGDPDWNPDADLDGDGHVGHGDLGIVLADWGCDMNP
ncbi:MAG TPA: immunoglobulin domain-containing protein [Phycisphaerae bacterium]|nr:immunoglobulin domain-containing protein [Phycisphaerae bacterium]